MTDELPAAAPCTHPNVEWFEECECIYFDNPRYAETKLKQLKTLTVARRRCLDCGAVEKEKQ